MNENLRNTGFAGTEADAAFVAAVRAELERSATETDAITLARLRAMRMRALEQPQRHVLPLLWQPAGMLALLTVAALGWMLLVQRPDTTVPAAEVYEQLAADKSDKGPGTIEAPEFYEWLDSQYGNDDNTPNVDQI